MSSKKINKNKSNNIKSTLSGFFETVKDDELTHNQELLNKYTMQNINLKHSIDYDETEFVHKNKTNPYELDSDIAINQNDLNDIMKNINNLDNTDNTDNNSDNNSNNKTTYPVIPDKEIEKDSNYSSDSETKTNICIKKSGEKNDINKQISNTNSGMNTDNDLDDDDLTTSILENLKSNKKRKEIIEQNIIISENNYENTDKQFNGIKNFLIIVGIIYVLKIIINWLFIVTHV